MAKSSVPQVSCPKCSRKQPDRGKDVFYYCDDCRMQFDLEDDGGDYSDHDPSARLLREERQRIERQNRTRARLGRR